MIEKDQLGNPTIILPQGWKPATQTQDKRQRHDAKAALAKMWSRFDRGAGDPDAHDDGRTETNAPAAQYEGF